MITQLQIQNFKCFEQLRLRFGQLTLLTGFNGGGKSSALQPLLILAQGLRTSDITSYLALNGPLACLGTAGDVLPSRSRHSSVRFHITTTVDEAVWEFSARPSDRFLMVKSANVRAPGHPDHSVATAPIQSKRTADALRSIARLSYLSAVREGAPDAYPMPTDLDDIGTDGRFAAYWYDQHVDDEVVESRRHPLQPATSLRKQLDAWLGSLFPGAEANVQLIPQISMLNLQFRLSDIGAWCRPANVGYGLSYAFPILVALLIADERQVVVVDSPEAHLHPFAQSQMGRLLAHFAAAGVQVIVETHSDHLLNGARIAVREGILPHTSMQIHFFTGARDGAHGVVSPEVDIDGRIDEWPEGFFDQSEKDLSQLAGWA